MSSRKPSVFVAATRQNDGKTMVTMGLYKALQRRFGKIGYMKPVGQQYKVVDNEKIDKDAILFQKAYNIEAPLSVMNPIALPSGFTHDYILNPDRAPLEKSVIDSFNYLQDHYQAVICEGTGHAGVGSVIDLSNADVAKLINTKVVLVSLGGIGRAIDEIMLNKACFDNKGIEILGVIINKIRKEKYDKITPISRQGFERLGIPVLGMIPFEDQLTYPTVEELVETINAEVLSGKQNLRNQISRFIIGAMRPKEAVSHFSPKNVLIVPADREGLIKTALGGGNLGADACYMLSAIVFSGGIRPSEEVLAMVKETPIPTLFVEADSFTIATKINSMLVKLRPSESGKIAMIQDLVENFVDVDRLCQQL